MKAASIIQDRARRWAALFFLILLPLFSAGCPSATPVSTCVSCHRGVEPVSAAHGDCVSCHGGDPQERDKEKSHASMRGAANPSDPENWENGCGECHRYQLERVKSTLMQTNAGMIRNIQLTWDALTAGTTPRPGEKLSIRQEKLLKPLRLRSWITFPESCTASSAPVATSVPEIPNRTLLLTQQAAPPAISPGIMKGLTKAPTAP